MKLSDAVNGCEISVPTIHGTHEVKLAALGSQTRFALAEKGAIDLIEEETQKGDHIAMVYTQVPKNINQEMKALAEKLLQVEQKIICS